jgi:hypothetical protein
MGKGAFVSPQLRAPRLRIHDGAESVSNLEAQAQSWRVNRSRR